MQPHLQTYLPLNPFVDLSVGEAEMWGRRAWLDVPEINAAAYASLRQCVELVGASRRSQVRFVRGMGGSGKSHLFARIRRELGESIFYAYAANPPLHADALEAFLLGKIVSSLRHKVRLKDGSEAPFTQLRLLAYVLLRPVIEQHLTFEEMHDAWLAVPGEERKDILHGAMLMLESEHPMVPRSILRTLLNVLRDDKENLAAQWMAGTTYLTDADLRFLGEPEPLVKELHGTVIHLLGKLAAAAGLPFVLVLDQLDLVTSSEALNEFQRLLFAFIDQSSGWSVFISLIGERFQFWESGLSQALRGRIGLPDPDRPELSRLQVIDVSPIVTSDKDILVRRRLAAPTLQRQREADGIETATFPLSDHDLKQLTGGGAVYARHLLAACSERYIAALFPDEPLQRVSLDEKMDALLQEAIDNARLESAYLGPMDLCDRFRELVSLLSEEPIEISSGPLQSEGHEGEVADMLIDTCGGTARVIVSDVTRRPLLTLLEHLQREGGNTLMLRGVSIGPLGQVSQNHFEAFVAKNHYLQVPSGELATLAGMGSLLASIREGNHNQLLTTPAATSDGMLQCLKTNSRLTSTKTWSAFKAALKGNLAGGDQPENPRPPVPTVKSHRLGSNGFKRGLETADALSEKAGEALKVILSSERWIEIHRLQKRLQEIGCGCSIETLRHALRTSALSNHVIMHPLDPVLTGDGPQIVLWHDSVD
ncbi:MAG: hypothetical protein JNJ83_24035 [Verrucomicrobiaceae bacterium]|nr:hypothetical protein [Verrucomicrobiaceae bacterium]